MPWHRVPPKLERRSSPQRSPGPRPVALLQKANPVWRTACFRVAKFGVVEPNVPHRHHDAIEFPDGSNVLVTLLVEGQRATVLQLPVVHQISGRTTKAEEYGSTPAAAASAAGRSCEVPAIPSGVSATKPEASAVTFFRPGDCG